MQRVFHAACALVFALSLWSFATAERRVDERPSARDQLRRLIAASGLEVVGERRILADEFMVEIKAPDCDALHRIVVLPSIHRISDVSWLLLQDRPDASFIHAREKIDSLSASSLIPRWITRRIMVNLQLRPEDPWISIALAVLPAQHCSLSKIRWERLGEP